MHRGRCSVPLRARHVSAVELTHKEIPQPHPQSFLYYKKGHHRILPFQEGVDAEILLLSNYPSRYAFPSGVILPSSSNILAHFPTVPVSLIGPNQA